MRALVGLFLLAPALAFGEARKPNIVFIVGDDMGYADLGVHGCKDIATPNLDALAKSGVRCTNGYVSGPYCSPTRAGLLTGRYQTRFGHEFNPAGNAPGLPLGETTIAKRLKEAGYSTGLVGKWHLGSGLEHQPQKRGFDEFFGFLGGAHPYFPGKGVDLYRGTERFESREYLTDSFGKEAVAFIDRHKSKPFFLYLAFNAVHTPMHADKSVFDGLAITDPTRRTYAAMMISMDRAIGKVIEKIRLEKLEEDTLICFISDNGGPTMTGTTTNGSVNLPLRGSKRTTLEGGVRVPFFVSWKGRFAAGKTYDKPVIQLDLNTTALAAAGIAPKAEWSLDGVNLLPFINGLDTGAPHEALFWRFGNQMAIRQGDWKLVRYDPAADGVPAKKAAGGVVGPRLYNLADDIGEKNDLMTKHPEKAKELQAKWEQWNKGNVQPLWGGKKQ